MKCQKIEHQIWPNTWTGRTMMSIHRFARSALVLMLALLTVQPAWGALPVWRVTAPFFQITDTQKKYHGKTYGYVNAEENSYIGEILFAGYNIYEERPVLPDGSEYYGETDHWSFYLGLRVKDWDRDGTPPTAGSPGWTIFDGVDDLQVVIKAYHDDPPHINTLNENGLLEFSGTGNKRTTSGSSSGHQIKVKASAVSRHTEATGRPHKDRVSAKYEFFVHTGDSANGAFNPLNAVTYSGGGVQGNVTVDARHIGSDPPVDVPPTPTGKTVGAATTGMYMNEYGSNVLWLDSGSVTTVADNPTTTAGVGSYGSDPVAGSTLPGIGGEYASLTDGKHRFVPLTDPGADEITFTAGDSILTAKWEEMIVDDVTGDLSVQFTEITYSDVSGEAGDNPSDFLDQLTDQHLFDPSDTQTDGLMFHADASSVLSSTNHFSTSDYSLPATTIILTGAFIAPEPSTLMLFSMGMLLMGLRRGAGGKASAMRGNL